MSERRSEPNVTKSGHMRTTSRDESERRDKDKEREGEQNGTQTRRASGITRSRSDLMKSQEARAGRKGCNTEGPSENLGLGPRGHANAATNPERRL